MDFVEKGVPLTYSSSGVIQKREKCMCVCEPLHTHLYIYTDKHRDRHLDRNKQGGLCIPLDNLLRKTLIKEAKNKQYHF